MKYLLTNTFFRRLKELTVSGVLVFLLGCASSPKIATGKSSIGAIDKELRDDMVLNLVSVVPQLLEPLRTTIQFNEGESGSTAAAVLKLVDLGYGVQRVDADQGKHFLRVTDVIVVGAGENQLFRLRLSLGLIELTRSFSILNKEDNIAFEANLIWRDKKAVIPVGPLQIAGTQERVLPEGFELAEKLADDSTSGLVMVKSRVEYTSSAPIEGGIPTISLITDELVNKVAQLTGPGLPNSYVDTFADTFEIENMSHVFDEAFGSISDNYDRVSRETVIFPNDSQNLGRPGKLMVKKLIERFSENTDLVGIVGCSNGPTRLEIGNEGLALGRAKRIAEEFYTAGITRDKIFNEGCWSSATDTPGFPNRGVVIDLWRRKS